MTEITPVAPQRSVPGSARALAGMALQDALLRSKDDPGFLQRIWDDVTATGRLYRAWRRKEYGQAPWRSILLGIAAALYFINPMDLVPDFLLIVGYIDDVTLLTLWMTSLRSDAQRFRAWEDQSAAALPEAATEVAPSEQIIEATAQS